MSFKGVKQVRGPRFVGQQPFQCPKCHTGRGRSKWSECANCATKAYRATENGKARHIAAVKQKNPDKRREYVHRWEERVSIRVPALKAFRRAYQRLQWALAQANQRERASGAGDNGDDAPLKW